MEEEFYVYYELELEQYDEQEYNDGRMFTFKSLIDAIEVGLESDFDDIAIFDGYSGELIWQCYNGLVFDSRL